MGAPPIQHPPKKKPADKPAFLLFHPVRDRDIRDAHRAWSATTQHVKVKRALCLLLDQLMPRLFGESLEVSQRTRIGGHHFQYLPALQLSERFFGFEDGQRAIQTAGINFFVDVHASCFLALELILVGTLIHVFAPIGVHEFRLMAT